MAKINNWDLKSNNFYSVGILKSIGDYEGRYAQEACEIMGIEGEFEEDEWCDICFTENPFRMFAVFANCEATSTGDFYYLEIKPDHPKYDELLQAFKECYGENYLDY